jgi:hypothetical protein
MGCDARRDNPAPFPSPLFTGDAGSGESEIRRFILENDLLEALIAIPEQPRLDLTEPDCQSIARVIILGARGCSAKSFAERSRREPYTSRALDGKGWKRAV